jgi:hypothetical protein
MKTDEPLPPIFTDGNICLLDAFVFRDQTTPVRTAGHSNFTVRLAPMRARGLRVRLDGEVHGFVEARGRVGYLPGESTDVPSIFTDPPLRRVDVQMIGERPTITLPPRPRPILPPMQLEPIDPPRVVAIRRVKSRQNVTLLLIDERNDRTIAVIGGEIHWDLEGIEVRFATSDGHELRP